MKRYRQDGHPVGEEIDSHRFNPADFAEYRRRLADETRRLADWFAHDRFPPCAPIAGYEIEACLVDALGRPAPVNAEFLERLQSEYVVPELARFNIEINAPPRRLAGSALRDMEAELRALCARCNEIAESLEAELLLIGILPTVAEEHLTLAYMSPQERYRALNEQVFRMRRGRPIVLDIEGREHLHTTHRDVMLESAATSFQVHLQVTPEHAVRAYNLAVILSAPMVAISANSPFLFGRDLWDETRIPLFEQSVGLEDARRAPARVTLGQGYVRESLLECFLENHAAYTVLLPHLKDEPPERLFHLRLHNGTIWRWNRPLVGFDDDGSPHLRIEHRVVPAGPSHADMLANAAFFFGLMQSLSKTETPLETAIPFEAARRNFYEAARWGLNARLAWSEGRRVSVRTLVLDSLLEQARRGCAALGLDEADARHYLGIIEARVASGRNGTAWQRGYVAQHGPAMEALTGAYQAHQRTGAPVHEWAA